MHVFMLIKRGNFRNGYLYKNQTLFKKQDNLLYVFIHKKPDSLRYVIFHEIFEIGNHIYIKSMTLRKKQDNLRYDFLYTKSMTLCVKLFFIEFLKLAEGMGHLQAQKNGNWNPRINTECVFLVLVNAPVPPPISKIQWKITYQKVSGFLCIKKRNANCLAFCEVSGFLDIKTSRNAKFHAFCIYKCQINIYIYKLRNLKCPDFCELKRNTNCLPFCKVSGFLYISPYRYF